VRGRTSRPGRRPAGGGRAEKRRGVRRERKTLASRLSRVSPRAVMLAILVIVFFAFAFGPTMRNLEATSQLKKKEAELRRQESMTAALEKQVAGARSLMFVETEARRQRLVKPGEVLYLVTSEDEGSKVEYRVKSLQSMDEAWERVRQMISPPSARGGNGG